MKAYALIAADLFAVLAVTFMVALGVLAPLVHTEVLTYIEETRTDKQSDAGAPRPNETVLLEVLYTERSGPSFILTATDKKKRKFTRYQDLIAAIDIERPQDIRMRMDRRVPSGIFQDIYLDTTKKGIRLWQVNEQK